MVTWANRIFVFTEVQYQILYSIAIQNPISVGPAVYSARSMLELIVDDFYEENNGNRMMPGGISFKKMHNVKIYPNPAVSYLQYQVRLSNNENGILKIHNGLGQLVSQRKLMSGFNNLSIETEGFANGLYFFSLETNLTYKSHEKVIINK